MVATGSSTASAPTRGVPCRGCLGTSAPAARGYAGTRGARPAGCPFSRSRRSEVSPALRSRNRPATSSNVLRSTSFSRIC
eukprot:2096067-Pyramimonas_sp.AAC.1